MNRYILMIFLFIIIFLLIKKEKFNGSENLNNIINMYNSNLITNEEVISDNVIVNNLYFNNNINEYFPKKTIAMWMGKYIPDGWVLCNGRNGTPDLRGRFVLSYNDDLFNNLSRRNIGEKGGEETHKLTINEIPYHIHNIGGEWNQNWFPKNKYTIRNAKEGDYIEIENVYIRFNSLDYAGNKIIELSFDDKNSWKTLTTEELKTYEFKLIKYKYKDVDPLEQFKDPIFWATVIAPSIVPGGAVAAVAYNSYKTAVRFSPKETYDIKVAQNANLGYIEDEITWENMNNYMNISYGGISDIDNSKIGSCNVDSLYSPTYNTGNDAGHPNMPPYYVLAFIMKL